jgi:hypothetical protein
LSAGAVIVVHVVREKIAEQAGGSRCKDFENSRCVTEMPGYQRAPGESCAGRLYIQRVRSLSDALYTIS